MITVGHIHQASYTIYSVHDCPHPHFSFVCCWYFPLSCVSCPVEVWWEEYRSWGEKVYYSLEAEYIVELLDTEAWENRCIEGQAIHNRRDKAEFPTLISGVLRSDTGHDQAVFTAPKYQLCCCPSDTEENGSVLTTVLMDRHCKDVAIQHSPVLYELYQ